MIFICGNVPSLKNSRVKGTYRPKTVAKYLQQLGIRDYSVTKRTVQDYKPGLKSYRPNRFREVVGNYFNGVEYPFYLGLHFVRSSRRKADFHNMCHIILDLLVAHQFIEDDNCDCVIPTCLPLNGRNYTVDKQNPGVYLAIIRDYRVEILEDK